jgi:4-hydroxybenzoate polyprenyltransferase
MAGRAWDVVAGRVPDVVSGLAVACHPLPCLAVTAFASGYAVSVGMAAARVALLASAVLTGQLSIGWCNDAVDAPLDVAVGRRDKPIVTSRVTGGVVAAAAGAALLACVICSLALGLVPGLVHLATVAAGWAYDLGLKSTPGSGLAYLVAFGALPAVATTALPHPRWPSATVMAGAALLGLAAHFANTVGDAEADAATGVRGLPQRVGPHRSLQVTAAGVGTAALLLLVGVVEGTARPRPVGVVLLAAGAVAAVTGLVVSALRIATVEEGPVEGADVGADVGVVVRPGVGVDAGAAAGRRTAFRITLAAVALVVLGLLVATGGNDADRQLTRLPHPSAPGRRADGVRSTIPAVAQHGGLP